MKRYSRFFIATVLWAPLFASAGASPEDLDKILADESTAPDSANKIVPTSAKKAPIYQFYASDKAAELTYERSGSVFGFDNDRAGVSFLFNEERDNAIGAYIQFDVEPQILPGLSFSFGPKLIAGMLSIENNDVIGLAASVEARYQLPVQKLPLQFSAAVSYAPDILTFGQSDRIFDWHVRAGLPLTENIDAFVGLRYLQFDTRPGERELDDQVHLGIRWSSDS